MAANKTNKPSHTPGPWAVATNTQNGRFCIDATGDQKIPVAVTEWTGDNQAHANAQLIATAPELLGALRAALDLITNPEISSDDIFLIANVEKKLEAAIAKAEGQS